ncbi:hypothetical protein ABZP36_020208 [Zizania latifolia]
MNYKWTQIAEWGADGVILNYWQCNGEAVSGAASHEGLKRGSEPFAETVVQLISRTRGISALAHPWALKNPSAVIRALKCAGLNALEPGGLQK